jgi:hypothetical protein
VFMPWVFPPADPLAKAKEQAHAVGCPTRTSVALIRCLRGMEAKDLVRNEVRATYAGQRFSDQYLCRSASLFNVLQSVICRGSGSNSCLEIRWQRK